MSIYVGKNKSYLEQYKEFISSKKTYTVKFYKEYEGDGGYWDWDDTWVSGATKRDTIVEKTFDNLETALGFADTTQEVILTQEKDRYRKEMKQYHSEDNADNLCWMSEFQYSFHTPDHHDIIYAYISWCGSSYKMKVTYNIVKE